MVWEHRMGLVAAAFETAHPFTETVVTLGDRKLRVLVASTPEQRARGMTGRSFGDYDGMLFIADDVSVNRFKWTGVDLLVGFYDRNGESTGTSRLSAEHRLSWSAAPWRFVLEVPVDSPYPRTVLGVARRLRVPGYTTA